MTHRRQSLGRAGENRAACFLEARGYRIVARNVRVTRVEIDLIAAKGALLVFVEVKSRRRTGRDGFGSHASAAEAVDFRKQARLRRGAHAWLAENPKQRRQTGRVRFDVITCLLSEEGIRDPFLAPTPNDNTAPREARWSIEHWVAAF